MRLLENEILSPGAKVKKIRKLLGLKQHDIAGDQITRNLISYIEHEKIKLMKQVAVVIAENINAVIAKRGLDVDSITADYLLEDKQNQAFRILGKIAEKLEEIKQEDDRRFIDEYTRAQKLLAEWDIPVRKMEIYRVVGEFYFDREEYTKAFEALLTALESSVLVQDTIKIAQIYVHLGYCSIKMASYKEALLFHAHAIQLLEQEPSLQLDLYKKSLFNQAIAYRQLGLHEEAFYYIERLQQLPLGSEEYIEVLMMKALRYKENKQYPLAEELYMTLLQLALQQNNLEIQAHTYGQLAVMFLQKGEFLNAINYAQKTLELEGVMSQEGHVATYLTLGQCYSKLGQNEKAVEIFQELIARRPSRIELVQQRKAIVYLLENYMEYNKDKELVSFLQEKKDLLLVHDAEIQDILLKVIFYVIEKDPKIAKKIAREYSPVITNGERVS